MKKTKKRNRSTLAVTAILLSLLIIGLIIVSVKNEIRKKIQYTPNFEITESLKLSTDKLLTANGIDKIEDEELDVLLENAKARILSCRQELDEKVDNLNWETLNQIKIYYSSKFIDELGLENDVKAHYNSNKNAVEVNLRAKGMSDLEETIIHEILHGLLGRNGINDSVGAAIIEALTEELSLLVVGESYEMYYVEEAQILHMMYNIWGEKETIKYILSGEKLFDKIDKLTKKGYGVKAMQGLDAYMSFKTYDIETATYVLAISQEIIVNATGKMAETLSEEEGRKMAEKCAELMPKIEEAHFKKILGL